MAAGQGNRRETSEGASEAKERTQQMPMCHVRHIRAARPSHGERKARCTDDTSGSRGGTDLEGGSVDGHGSPRTGMKTSKMPAGAQGACQDIGPRHHLVSEYNVMGGWEPIWRSRRWR